MNKVFLSHSSHDKKHYLEKVAELLGKENIEYDAITFEEGERTQDEIEQRLAKCDMFALFISKHALDSKWVQDELNKAWILKQNEVISKIYPIIIDDSIAHTDARIPDWLKSEYNLKYISRPVVAARRIQTKLRELHWSKHPLKKERQSLFVGRNELIKDFEIRIDDIDQLKPSCILASGIKKIGRSSLLSHALVKANLVKQSYIPIKIYLERVDSIEDFIIKLFDTGLSSVSSNEISNMLEKSMQDKINILHKVLEDIQNAKEIIFIEDKGCLIDHKRQIAEWLISALSDLENRPVLCVSAPYKIHHSIIRGNKNFYYVEVPELNPTERSGLFRRLLELHNLDIENEDFITISSQLTGFPEEAHYSIDLILDYGIKGAMNRLHEIREFSNERASALLRKFDGNKKALEFIYFLSEFEFIGISFIYEIVGEEEYKPILEDIVTNSICDFIGNEQEYIRLNDSIRDLIKRNRLELGDSYKEKLKNHVKDFLTSQDKFERDASDFFYSIKESLANGDEIEEKYLIPSHILRTIRDLYFRRENLKRIVHLADILLIKEKSIDPKVAEDVRYYLCLALARQKDKRVLSEAVKINGPEHDFILGYYYRLCGRHDDAIERLSKIVNTPYISARAKRELVQAYLMIEEYEKAMSMAKENYDTNKGNQYPIQSYLNCLLNSENPSIYKTEIQDLIKELEEIGSTQSKEMSCIAKSLYEAKIENNKPKAYECIDDAIAIKPDAPYPYLALFDIALKFLDQDKMLESLNKLENLEKTKVLSTNTIIKNRAFYYASIGRNDEANELITNKLENHPKETIEKFLLKIENIQINAANQAMLFQSFN